MEGIIMEVREKTLIVLTPDGGFIEMSAPLDQLSVGQTIPVPKTIQSQLNITVQRLSLMVASFLLVMVIGLTSYGYTQTFGYLNLDINPSVLISYNWFQRVIRVESLNDDGQEILLDSNNLKHIPLKAAVNQLISTSVDKGYIHSAKDNIIYISVSDRSSSIRSTKILNALSSSILVPDQTDYAFIKGSKNNFSEIKNVPQSVVKKWIDEDFDLDDDLIIKSSKPIKELLKKSLKEKQEKSDKVKVQDNKQHNIKDEAPNTDKETEFEESPKGKKEEKPVSDNASDNATKTIEEKNNKNEDKLNNGQSNKNNKNKIDKNDEDSSEENESKNNKGDNQGKGNKNQK